MDASSRQRIGDILVAQGAINRATLERHIKHMSGRVGQYLLAHNLINGYALARGVATHLRLHFVHLDRIPPNRKLFKPSDFPHYARLRYIPFARAKDGLIVATAEPSLALKQELETYYGTKVQLIATGPQDIARYFAQIGGTASTRKARLSLRRIHPQLVADRTLVAHQKRGLIYLIIALTTLLCISPYTSWEVLLVVCNLFYLASLYMKMKLFRQGHTQHLIQKSAEHAIEKAVNALTPDMLPMYSILVPLYQESWEVMGRLLANLMALDYPREKLDIKLICEADDTPTITALKALNPPQIMQIVIVPPSHPRTKPKACNIALQQIRGEYVVIYDAEDAPQTDQLKRAVALFRRLNPRVACLQASLNYYNRQDTLLTQLFSIEYSALFRLSLPALERMGMPIPLGGTSNHLRVSALHAVGGWDAFNVTEDADLGVRLAYMGYKTRMLPSLTLEEAPLTLGAWMRQRTRWIKGYIQTWLVYMRHPAELKRRLGYLGYYGFQFFVGAPVLIFLLSPFLWSIFLLSITGGVEIPLLHITQVLCLASFIGGVASNWIFARAAMEIEHWTDMRFATLVYPLYWLLHSFAAAMALCQLVFRPHYWGKTRHGMTQVRHYTHRATGKG